VRLEGKVGIVTGAAHGIGGAIAELFARQGARVVLADVDATALDGRAERVRAAGGDALAVAADVSDAEQVDGMIGSALEAYGALHIVVNNAVWYVPAPLLETSDADWERTLAVGLTSVFRICRAAVPHLIAAGGGAIVNIASINQIVGSTHLPAYTAAKGGVRGLTKQLAVDYGRFGIRCNAISPGLIMTDRIRAALGEREERINREAYPIGRVGEVGDVAYAALYLASDESSFVTGVDLPVDGGLTSLNPAVLVSSALRRQWGRPPIDVLGGEAE
jgi:NAD(P)-dependent dehydrogenase (short-subunit alcohol dehydrogenase family)